MYILRMVISIVIVFIEIYIIDPWKVHFYYSSQDMNEIILVCLAMSIITAVIGVIFVPPIIHKIFLRTRIRNALTIGIATFVILAVIAILCGPYGCIDIFKNRILVSFFGETRFLIFVFQVALPFSFVTAGLEFFFGKKYAVAIPEKTEDKILKL